MKKYICSTIIALIFANLAIAQTERILTGNEAVAYFSGAEMIRFKDKQSAPNFIRLKAQNRVPLEDANLWLKKLLKTPKNNQLKQCDVLKDKLGMTHYKFQQEINNVPVEGARYILHTKDNLIYSANGLYYSSINLNTNPSVSAEMAIQKAKEAVPSEKYMWEINGADARLQHLFGNDTSHYYPNPTLCIVAENGDYKNPVFHLAWKMDIYSTAPLARYWVYVDAQTGDIVWKLERIHTTDVPGTANTAYSGTQNIVCNQNGSTFQLREAGRGNGIETYNMNNGTNYNAVTDFTNNNANFNTPNPASDVYGYDAHWGAEMTYDYYFNEHSRNSIDNGGFKLISYVHYDVGFENAFWDGQEMTYGDGDTYFTSPLTAIDVTGHEITHGLTSYTANLDYLDESGALNESFSDIFGATIDNYARGTTGSPLWLIGEDTHAGGIRDMSNPSSFSMPDTYLGVDYYIGTADNGGVHNNSGVQNFWYYLLVSGGSGTNDNNDNYTVAGLGLSSAASIAFRNLTVYLGNTSDYSDARFYAILSATDLYGGCSQEVESTTNAWYAVGVGTIYSPVTLAAFSTPITDFCQAPATVNFTNNSQNGVSYLWDFGDGSTSTQQSPTHTYANLGQFTVELTVNGGACGNDDTTLTNYISLDTALPCSVTLTTSGTNQLQTSCAGILSDDGGISSNYSDNITSTITISPTNATSITLTFTDFNFEDSYDFLTIYDGPTTASPVIGSYTGGAMPNGGTIVSTSGSVTIKQESDPYLNESGFVLNWQCSNPSLPPTADFQANNLTSCNGVVSFADESTNGASTWLWDFGDGTTSMVQNPTHTYLSAGTYSVKLIVTNIVGSDTITKTNYIVVSLINETPFNFIESSPSVVTFTNTTTGGTSYSWNFGDGNNSSLENPVHTYTTPGNYTVNETITSGTCSKTITSVVTVKGYSGINENFKNNFGVKVFPNPANGDVTVSISVDGTKTIQVIATSGQILIEKSTNEMSFNLDLSRMESGIYFINIQTSQGNIVKKVIKN